MIPFFRTWVLRAFFGALVAGVFLPASFGVAASPEREGGVRMYRHALRLLHGEGVRQDPHEAVALLRDAARAGVPAAQHELGVCYLSGVGMLSARPRTGFRWVKRAAENDYPPAMYRLAEAYLAGIGTRIDEIAASQWLNRLADMELTEDLPEEEWQLFSLAQRDALDRLGTAALSQGDEPSAFAYWSRGAQIGDLSSILNAARMLALGRGTETDLERANGYLETARRQVASRMRRVAREYHSHALLADSETFLWQQEAVEQSAALIESMRIMIAQELTEPGSAGERLARGAQWFRLAAQSGSTLASARLGILYLEGHHELVSQEEALASLEEAAAADVWIAQHAMGVYYTLVEPDEERAQQWFEQAAADGFFASTLALADPTYRRPILFPENLRLAVEAADAGDPTGAFYRGLYHWVGMGVPEDAERAAKWFALAAQGGHPGGIHYQGLFHLKGEHPSDPALSPVEAAVDHFLRAAKMDYAPSHAILGRLFALGAGVERDTTAAERHYRHAIELDPSSEANFHLAEVREKAGASGSEVIGLYRAAAEGGYAAAMTRMGDLYRQGHAGTEDFAMAYGWYQRALAEEAEQADALYGLGILAREGLGRPADGREALGYFERAGLKGHLGAARFAAIAYRDGTSHATHRPTVAARFFKILVEHGETAYLPDLCRMLLKAGAYEDLEQILLTTEVLRWEMEKGALAYFRGYLRYHGFEADQEKPHHPLSELFAAARAGFPDAQTFVLRLSLREATPDQSVFAIWNAVDSSANPDAYFYKGRLAYERPELFRDTTTEEGLAMMETAAEEGSIDAMCYLDDLRRDQIQGAPSREQLMDWLTPYAARGFEEAIDRLASIHAELEDEPPARRKPGLLERYGEGIAAGRH